MTFRLEQTYLYKIHLLANRLDKLFDDTLREHVTIGLSHFLILLTVRRHGATTSKEIAGFLRVSPAAVSRQVDSAHAAGWLSIRASDADRRVRRLHLTANGKTQVRNGLRVLESEVFPLFESADRQAGLMSHIDVLLMNMKGDTQ